MFKVSQITLTGLICVIMLAIGLGFVFPVSGAVGAYASSWLSRLAFFLSGCLMANNGPKRKRYLAWSIASPSVEAELT